MDNAYTPATHHLPPDTILHGKYLLGRAIGEGGFGITYEGRDLALDLKVAVKEYYPSGFVTREATVTGTVQPFAGTQGDFFLKGRERFIEEARSLARFSSMPGIVSVRDFFPENGTAYIVMEFIEGQTFKSYLQNMGGRLPAVQVLDMMRPVMHSLAAVHAAGLIHRDISPDNIMISHDGYMKLLDFGAAKEFAESGNRSLSVMLKPGFSPEEQYRSRGVQGPWTDIYALCATMYRAVTGVMPEESSERLRQDTLQTPAQLGIPMPPAQEAALLKGMAVLQENRWQDVPSLMAAMDPDYATATVSRVPAPAPMPPQPPVPPMPYTMSAPMPVPQGPPIPQKEKKPFVWPLSKKLTAILAGGLVAVTALAVGLVVAVNHAAYKKAYDITDAYWNKSGTVNTESADYNSLYKLWNDDNADEVKAILTEGELAALRSIQDGWDRERVNAKHQDEIYQAMQDFASDVNARLKREAAEREAWRNGGAKKWANDNFTNDTVFEKTISNNGYTAKVTVYLSKPLNSSVDKIEYFMWHLTKDGPTDVAEGSLIIPFRIKITDIYGTGKDSLESEFVETTGAHFSDGWTSSSGGIWKEASRYNTLNSDRYIEIPSFFESRDEDAIERYSSLVFKLRFGESGDWTEISVPIFSS